VRELATTTVSVLRGTETNQYGDRTNVGQPVYTGIPAALVESAHRSYDRAAQRYQVLRTSIAVVPDWADIRTSDTLVDERTCTAYMVEAVTMQPTLGPPPDKVCDLRARSGVSVQAN